MARKGPGPSEAAVLRTLAERLDVFQTLRDYPELSAAGLREMLLRAAERAAERAARNSSEEAPPQQAPEQAPEPPAPVAERPLPGTWRLFTDGASRGNPGPAGAGYVLIDPRGEVVCQRGVPLGRTTNNVAEYEALRLGLEEALRRGVRRLTVNMDSELVVRHLSGRYRVKSPHLSEIYHQVKQLLAKFERHDIVHVERALNQAADALASQAAATVSV